MKTVKKMDWGYAVFQPDEKTKRDVQCAAAVKMVPLSVEMSKAEMAELEKNGEVKVSV